MGFEPTTFSLARRRSTTELHPRPVEDTVKVGGSQAGANAHALTPRSACEKESDRAPAHEIRPNIRFGFGGRFAIARGLSRLVR